MSSSFEPLNIFKYLDDKDEHVHTYIELAIDDKVVEIDLFNLLRKVYEDIENNEVDTAKEQLSVAAYYIYQSTVGKEDTDSIVKNLTNNLDTELRKLLDGQLGADDTMDNESWIESSEPRKATKRVFALDGGDTADKTNPFSKPKTKADFENGVWDKSEEAVTVLLHKHEDYGPKNISSAPGGPVNGLSVRLHDKVSRLAHLLQTGADPKNESIYDTFLDIANYGLIGMLVIDGMWDGE
jgi:hypothetical protein